jgi:hypothetical protein
MLLTEVYGLLCLLLIAGFVFRPGWRQSQRTGPRAVWKRTGRSARWYLLRLGVTAMVAWAIAAVAADDAAALVWVVIWVGLYWLWKLWDRWRGKGVARPADGPAATAVVVPQPQALPDGGTPRPLWRRVVRKTGTLAAGAVVFIVVMAAVMILCLGYYERQARAERNKVQIGMTVDEVLPLVHGGYRRTRYCRTTCPTRQASTTRASWNTRMARSAGPAGADYRSRQLTEDEAVALMKQKMSDGYDWRWRYTFINDTPQHFSFTVTFGRDGRVKNVTDVWGWD